MDPKTLIESYVDDVARRLPRRLRADVALELRALLTEELAGRASEAGREPDEAMALALLRGFGAPADVADRYRPGGFNIVQPQAARGFALLCLGGLGLQWALTLPGVLLGAASADEAAVRLGSWWLTGGLGAFWWPGFLVTIAIIAGWIAQRWPSHAEWAPRRVVDPDRVNRPLLSLGLAAWLVGAGIVLSLPWVAAHGPQPLARIFAFDPAFLRWKAWWLPPLWTGHFLLYAVVMRQGRWRPLTRRVGLGFSLATSLLCGWWATGPIFTAPTTDGLPRVALAILAVGGLVGVVVGLWREQTRLSRTALHPAMM
jgi:hypothetical protein